MRPPQLAGQGLPRSEPKREGMAGVLEVLSFLVLTCRLCGIRCAKLDTALGVSSLSDGTLTVVVVVLPVSVFSLRCCPSSQSRGIIDPVLLSHGSLEDIPVRVVLLVSVLYRGRPPPPAMEPKPYSICIVAVRGVSLHTPAYMALPVSSFP